MGPARVELRPSIDRTWLESEERKDPVSHAFALWDLDRFPQQVRFVTVTEEDLPVGYLLVWHVPGRTPVVHWVGPARDDLAASLPPPPVTVIGPEEVAPVVARARGPAEVQPIQVRVAPLGAPEVRDPHEDEVRRLRPEDAGALTAWLGESVDPELAGYAGIDLTGDVVFGGFEGSRLVGVARAVVRRPLLWFLGGVYVRPTHRNRGWGAAVSRGVLREAARSGAPCALFVREDRPAARAIYARLGFHPVGRRVWVHCGTHSSA